MTPGMTGAADYFLDHYGTCDLGADCYWSKLDACASVGAVENASTSIRSARAASKSFMQWMKARS
jgi:hypothetical protein